MVTAKNNPLISARKSAEIEKLYQEFAETFLNTATGQSHLAQYRVNRQQAERNYAEILTAVEKAEDITDSVLLKLLPYADTAPNQERGAWISIAAAIQGDLRGWYERKGWTQTNTWPNVAEAILHFIHRCIEYPDQLEAACEQFANSPYSTGFQSGMLSPILNALQPDDFAIVNNKSRKVLNYLLGQKLSQSLRSYAFTNRTVFQSIHELSAILNHLSPSEIREGDRFDAFCHWLVAVKKFQFKEIRYWRMTPKEAETLWPIWCNEGYVGMGFNGLGDLSEIRRSAFDALRDQLSERAPKQPKRHANQLWRFAQRIQAQDRIVVTQGVKQLLGIGTVTGTYYFAANENLGHRYPVEWENISVRSITEMDWQDEFGEITEAVFNKLRYAPIDYTQKPIDTNTIKASILAEPSVDYTVADTVADAIAPSQTKPLAKGEELPQQLISAPSIQPLYSLADCANHSYFEELILARWVRTIQRKKQAIFHGPPGTGKTFMADQLAKHLIGGGNGFMALIQFHPAYAYEDFMQGIRPQSQADGSLTYPIMPGRFLDFCHKATQREGPCVLIIDEINRANLASVFGELMYLLEYREQFISLAGGDRPFHIPNNVYIIGTMNTTDRSIALVDYALRRRFAFLALDPAYDVLRRYHERRESVLNVDALVKLLQEINQQIGDKQFFIGISFFMWDDLTEILLEDIWKMEIEPYLEEYFFDHPSRLEKFRWARVGSRLIR